MNARGSQQTMPPTGPLAWHLIFNRRGPFSQMLRQQLTDLGVLQSTCGSIMQTCRRLMRRLPLSSRSFSQ